ncbi:MAG: hypothetical protein Q9227_009207 [Pyrenula ochraceoflavens]
MSHENIALTFNYGTAIAKASKLATAFLAKNSSWFILNLNHDNTRDWLFATDSDSLDPPWIFLPDLYTTPLVLQMSIEVAYHIYTIHTIFEDTTLIHALATGYYADLLTPTSSPQTRKPAPPPTQPPSASPSERAKILFGTGSRRYNPTSQTTSSPTTTWRTINGVPIPPRPAEPDNCCMSGCMHCVWDDYRDSIEEWASRVKVAQAQINKTPANDRKRGTVEPKQRVAARREVADAARSMDDDGGGSETNWAGGGAREEEEDEIFKGLAEGRDLFESIPVGIREFIKTEKRLRDLHIQEKQTRKEVA